MEFEFLLLFALCSVCRESMWAQMQAGESRKALGFPSLVTLEIFSGSSSHRGHGSWRVSGCPVPGVAVPVVPCVLWDFWSLWHASLGGSETDACSPGPPWDSTGTFRDPAEGLPSTSALVAQKLTMCPSSSYDPGASVHTHSPQGKWGESRSSPLRRGRGPLGRRPGQGRGSAIAPGCTELLAGL